jgi:hypothetical protein
MERIDTQDMKEIAVDPDNLYREEIFTDLKIATIRRLVPITAEGTADPRRKTMFVGQTNLMTPAGPLPIQAKIEAETLSEAIRKFPEETKKAIERVVNEVREMEREEASRIVLPGEVPGGGQVKLT